MGVRQGLPGFKIDIVGSTLTRGLQGTSRATRIGIARDLKTGVTDLNTAIDRAVTAAGNFYPLPAPNDQDLPLFAITAQRWGENVLVRMQYRPTRMGSLPNDPYTVASFRGTQVPMRMYRLGHDWGAPDDPVFDSVTGLPAGRFESHDTVDDRNDINKRPKPYYWYNPGFTVHIPAVLPYNPLASVANLQGAINSDDVLFNFGGAGGTWTILPRRIRFDRVEVDWQRRNTGDVFLVNYVFTFLHGQWVQQSVRWNEAGAFSTWKTDPSWMAREATFADAFPI